MDKLKKKHDQLLKALDSLEKSLTIFKTVEQKHCEKNKCDEEYRIHRDSIIQRFEYSVDLFWKYLQKYLEDILELTESYGPKPVIRESFSARLLNEEESESALNMIKDRNMTSHMYVEEIAEQLAGKIPMYYQLIFDIANKIQPKK